MREFGLAADALKKALALNPPNAAEVEAGAGAGSDLAAAVSPRRCKIYQELVDDDPMRLESYLRMSQIYRSRARFHQGPRGRPIRPAPSIRPIWRSATTRSAFWKRRARRQQAIQTLRTFWTTTAKRIYSPDENAAPESTLLRPSGGRCTAMAEQTDLAVDTFRQIGGRGSGLGAAVRQRDHRNLPRWARVRQGPAGSRRAI